MGSTLGKLRSFPREGKSGCLSVKVRHVFFFFCQFELNMFIHTVYNYMYIHEDNKTMLMFVPGNTRTDFYAS